MSLSRTQRSAAWLGLALSMAAVSVTSSAAADAGASEPENTPSAGGVSAFALGPATQPRRASWLDLEAVFGFAFGLARDQPELPRLALSGALWPQAKRVGLGLDFASGPSARVVDTHWLGRVFVGSAMLEALYRLDPTRAFRASAAAGAGVQIAVLEGFSPLGQSQDVSIARATPRLGLELRADFLLSSELFVGLRVGGVFLLQDARFVVDQRRVFALSRAWCSAGIALGLGLPD